MGLRSVRNAFVFGALVFITCSGLATHYATQPTTAEALEDRLWIQTSKSWIDRQFCGWLGLCGIKNLFQRSRWPNVPGQVFEPPKEERNNTGFWDSGDFDAGNASDEELSLREIPQYVLDHAPYVHLYSDEQFWPGDLGDHLIHTTPFLNYTPLDSKWRHPNLTGLDKINQYGRHTFLQSDDNVELRPDWLEGAWNIPTPPHQPIPDSSRFPGRQGHWRWHPQVGIHEDPDYDKWWRANTSNIHKIWDGSVSGEAERRLKAIHGAGTRKTDLKKRTPSAGGRSEAPVVMLVIDKGDGIVDAFWFYFYSYNQGNKVFNIRFGDHVGDWEHTCIRFYNGKPKAIFLSEHDNGAAYAWEAVEKIGLRPVTYSAVGTHAMYATPGVHTYVLPFGLLHDVTDRGPLWDPVLNLVSYTYDWKKDHLRSSTANLRAPTDWFYFWGHWGDKFYPLSDPRQYRFAGQYHYVNGPLGPRFKRLARKRICQGSDVEDCKLQYWIQERIFLSSGPLQGEGEEHDVDDVQRRNYFGRRR